MDSRFDELVEQVQTLAKLQTDFVNVQAEELDRRSALASRVAYCENIANRALGLVSAVIEMQANGRAIDSDALKHFRAAHQELLDLLPSDYPYREILAKAFRRTDGQR